MHKLAIFGCLFLSPFIARADFMYTFSNPNVPFTFSFTEPSIVTAPGSLGIAAFSLDGFTFTQNEVFNGGGGDLCFFFGTAGVSGDCSSGSVPAGGAVMFSDFANPTAVGTYASVPNIGLSIGITGFPTQLTISAVPEPSSVALLVTMLGGFAFLLAKRRRLALGGRKVPRASYS